ncbi:hypothetical protein TraAM80_08851 [Trypanosoma rangeli]|uniref:Uncharacterized protein n=1 Tax=Trypanosoma rangeli TaxID=5698 RepID=A0A3R7K061_TRYRA|nr:uncharacterized protein TraAM80_08851 [Trypanosoma rangeli]RNE98278.1 hypothetical protein TraAM80_08851 [Trypanosoma rangeli]|eukprot:RNE98278.1 hypothetical protein TraAM80_08851 [Trypanosoma rangeli]
MYRSKKSGGRPASSAMASEDSVGEIQGGITPDATSDVATAATVMAFKARLMAPFMLYDRKLRQVVSNPAHDRHYRSEVSRVQGVVLRELRHALEQETSTTPKEMLYAVQKAVMLAYASCAVSRDTDALVPLSSDEEATGFGTRLESFFGERNASAKAVASLAAVLATGIVRDIYKEACNRLEARLTLEGQSHIEKSRTKERNLALEATRKNTQDLMQLRGALVTAFEAINTPFNENGITPLPSSATVDETTAVLTVESYYNLLGWVLMMQPERLGLMAVHSTPTLYQEPQAAEKLFAKVTLYDPLTGRIVIERTNAASKWGIMLNASGALVGVENALRNATAAGGALYHALQQRKTGLPIFDIDDTHIDGAEGEETEGNEDAELARANTKAVRLENIRKTLQQSGCVISLRVAKVTTLGEPQEIAFDIIPQGGEDAAGQQAALILKRPSTDVQWQLQMQVHAESVFLLEGFAASLPLSKAAKKFLSTHCGHLVIMQVNGCDATHGDLIMDVIRSSLYLVLRLRVVSDVEKLVSDATTKQEVEAIEARWQTEEALEAVPGAAVSHEEREIAEDEEAEVAQHRALLEEHNIHPDEPLPEVNEAEGASLPKKKGRPKKLNAEEDAMRESELPEEVKEAPTAVPELELELEGTSLPKKKGQPHGEVAFKKGARGRKKKLSQRALREAKRKAKEEKRKKRQEMKSQSEKKEVTEAMNVKATPFEKVAKEQGVLETPLVNIQSHSKLAAEVEKKTQLKKPVTPAALQSAAAVEEAQAASSNVPSVSAVELNNAPPLTFENAVTLDRFDGSHMELRRPDLKTPWDMKVFLGPDNLVLTRLPPISASLKTHPFLKSLRPDMDGRIHWLVDGVNGTDLTTASKALRAKALESIKKTNKISLLLRPLTK